MGQVLYQLPDGWEWHSVKKLSHNIQYGHTAKAESNGNAKFLRITDIQDGSIDWQGVPTLSLEEKEISKYALNDDDLVFARSGATAGKSILIKNAPKDAVFASYLIRIVPNKKDIIPEYLSYFFLTPAYWEIVSQNSAGAAQPNINGTKLSEFIIPVAPHDEQKRIVEKLDALLTRIDTAIDHLQESVTLADALFRSALNRVFNPSESSVNSVGDYGLPEDWIWMTVKKLSKKIQYGHTAKAADKGSAQFLRITDIQDNNIDWLSVPYVEITNKDIEKYALTENDLVFARSGATAGKSILIKKPPQNAIFASYLIRIVPNVEIVQPEYLELFFRSPAYWDIVKASTTGAAQPNVNGTKLGEFKVPIPKLETQRIIVDEMTGLSDLITDLKKELKNKLTFLESAKSSILDSAFKGEI